MKCLNVSYDLALKIYNHTATLILSELLAKSPPRRKWFSLPYNHFQRLGITRKQLQDGIAWLESCDPEYPMIQTKWGINKNSTITDYFLVNRNHVDNYVNRPWTKAHNPNENHMESIKECLSATQIQELEGKL